MHQSGSQSAKEMVTDALRFDFDRLFTAVYRYLRVRLVNNEQAEDLASETLCLAWRKAASYFPDQGDVLPWLIGIAKNQLKMHWRRQHVSEVDWECVSEFVSDDGRAGMHMTTALDLERVLAHLSEEQRALVLLHYVDGFSYAELSRQSGVSETSLRQTVSRTLRHLRRVIFNQSSV